MLRSVTSLINRRVERAVPASGSVGRNFRQLNVARLVKPLLPGDGTSRVADSGGRRAAVELAFEKSVMKR